MMLAAVVARDAARANQCAVGADIVADCEALQGAAGVFHHAGDGGTADAAAQQYPGWMLALRLMHRTAQRIDQFILERLRRQHLGFVKPHAPIAVAQQAPALQMHKFAGPQTPHAALHCIRRRDIVKVQVVVERLRIDRLSSAGMQRKRFGRGGKHDGAANLLVEHRARGAAINRDQHLVALLIEDGECEMAAEGDTCVGAMAAPQARQGRRVTAPGRQQQALFMQQPAAVGARRQRQRAAGVLGAAQRQSVEAAQRRSHLRDRQRRRFMREPATQAAHGRSTWRCALA